MLPEVTKINLSRLPKPLIIPLLPELSADKKSLLEALQQPSHEKISVSQLGLSSDNQAIFDTQSDFVILQIAIMSNEQQLTLYTLLKNNKDKNSNFLSAIWQHF